MSAREQVYDSSLATRVLVGARVSSLEWHPVGPDALQGEAGSVVLRFDNGATMYADFPTVYRDEVAKG